MLKNILPLAFIFFFGVASADDKVVQKYDLGSTPEVGKVWQLPKGSGIFTTLNYDHPEEQLTLRISLPSAKVYNKKIILSRGKMYRLPNLLMYWGIEKYKEDDVPYVAVYAEVLKSK